MTLVRSHVYPKWRRGFARRPEVQKSHAPSWNLAESHRLKHDPWPMASRTACSMGLQKGNLQVSKDNFGRMTAQTSESLENPIWKMSWHHPQGHGKHHSVTSKGIAIGIATMPRPRRLALAWRWSEHRMDWFWLNMALLQMLVLDGKIHEHHPGILGSFPLPCLITGDRRVYYGS